MFSLAHAPDGEGHQIRVSGRPQSERRTNLASIAERFAARWDGLNCFEDDWRKMADHWAGWDVKALDNRRRALLVTNSYADAAVVADALAAALDAGGFAGWRVHCLVRDRDEGGERDNNGLSRARAMPRSLVERFGLEPDPSILVAPLQVIARGHNILNTEARPRSLESISCIGPTRARTTSVRLLAASIVSLRSGMTEESVPQRVRASLSARAA